MPTDISLHPATAEDAPFLLALFEDVRCAEFAPLGLPAAALAQLLTMQHRAQTSGYAMQYPQAVDYVIRREGERVGRLMVMRGKDEIHVIDIAILARFRRAGIGTMLLRGLCEEAKARAVPVRLSVRVDNPAQYLYARLGFTVTGGDGVNLAMHWPA